MPTIDVGANGVTCRRSLRRAAIVAAGGWLCLVFGVRAMPAPGADESSMSATQQSPCQGGVAVVARSIELCGPIAVSSPLMAGCPTCAGGIHAVYIMHDHAIGAGWQVVVAVRSIQEL